MWRIFKIGLTAIIVLGVLAAAPWALRNAAKYIIPDDELLDRSCVMSDGRTGEIVRSGFWRREYCRAERK